jgi:predicted ArsR family transcriptional regulator
MTLIITRQRADILDYLKGCPGTVREVMAAMGWTNAQTVSNRVNWLHSAGLLRYMGEGQRRPGSGRRPRTYQTTDAGAAVMNMVYGLKPNWQSFTVTQRDIEREMAKVRRAA